MYGKLKNQYLGAILYKFLKADCATKGDRLWSQVTHEQALVFFFSQAFFRFVRRGSVGLGVAGGGKHKGRVSIVSF